VRVSTDRFWQASNPVSLRCYWLNFVASAAFHSSPSGPLMVCAIGCNSGVATFWKTTIRAACPWCTDLRSGAYRVFTRKRVFLVKSSVTILRTGLHGAVNGHFAHNNLRSGTAFRPFCQLYTIQSVSQR